MPGVSPLGTVSYGGYTFPTAIHTSFNSIPVPDVTGRTIKYVRNVIRVETIVTLTDIAPSGNFNDLFQALITTLSRPGQTLTLTSILDGGSIVHGSGDDFEFGPTPQNISWEPIGGNKAFKLVWECAYTRANCNTQQRIAAFSSTSSMDVAEDGMARLTTTFTYELGVKRISSHYVDPSLVQQLLSDLRSFYKPIPRFNRTWNTSIATDFKTVTITATDEEIKSDNPYQPYMIRMNLRESLKGGLATGGLKRWMYRIGGTLSLAPGISGSYAWIAFLRVVQTRLQSVASAGNNSDGTRIVAIAPEFEWDSEIYGRDVSFSIAYTLVCDLAQVLKASGIWKPVPGSWSEWATSMEGVQQVTGYSDLNLGERPNANVIIDFCFVAPQPDKPTAKRNPSKPYDNPSHSNQCPPESSSWMEYENKLFFSRETNTIEHYPLSAGDEKAVYEIDENGAFKPSQGSNSNVKQPHTQARGASVRFLTIVGKGVRVGYKVPIPKVTKIGNTIPTLFKERLVASHIVGWSGNCPIYAASWVRTYRYYSDDDGKAPTIEGVPPGYKTTN